MREIISELLKNELFSIGDIHFYAYGLCIAIGIVLGLTIVPKRLKSYPEIKSDIYNFILFVILTGFLGAKLLSLITTINRIWEYGFVEWIKYSGLVVYGGIILGTLSAYFYVKKKNENFFYYADFIMPLVALVQGFGRIGCLFAGCCYGKPTDSVFSVTYIYSDNAPLNIPLFPSQLVSALFDIILFVVLLLIDRYAKKYTGQILVNYLIVYSIGRFIIEFFRGDEVRGRFLIFSTSQWISIVLIIISLYLMKRLKGKTGE